MALKALIVLRALLLGALFSAFEDRVRKRGKTRVFLVILFFLLSASQILSPCYLDSFVLDENIVAVRSENHLI